MGDRHWSVRYVGFMFVSTICCGVTGQSYRRDIYTTDTITKTTSAFTTTADECAKSLGTSLGNDFLSCAIDGTLEAMSKANIKIAKYNLNPLNFYSLDSKREGVNNGLLIKDLLRNYTCARFGDGGTSAVSTESWIWNAQDQQCSQDKNFVLQQLLHNVEIGDIAAAQKFKQAYDRLPNKVTPTIPNGDIDPWFMSQGYLPAGGELDMVELRAGQSAEDVKPICEQMAGCAGFTMTGGSAFLKSIANKASVTPDEDWVSYIHQKPKVDVCKNEGTTAFYQKQTEYTVEVIRESPYVAVIKNFSTPAECADLKDQVSDVWNTMSRAYEGGGQSSYRQSYAENVYVDYDDTQHKVTKLSERMFGAVRDLTKYNVHGNIGQEPLNIVLYKNKGDEYRPHCDGGCYGEPYTDGYRVATSILYCETADHGGQTSFTRSGVMISPEPNDFLIFGYKLSDGMMDDGKTEHSGCPILKGQKWIATQWYREGVSESKLWDSLEA